MDLFAGLAVTDRGRAVAWYTRLLGRDPAFFPNDREAVWEVAAHRFVYVVEDAARAGGGLALLFLGPGEDLDELVAAARRRGLEPAAREAYGNGVRKVVYRDPDGNELGLGGRAAR